MNPTTNKQAARRAEIAYEALHNCRLCPRNCGVDRTAGKVGYCGLDDSLRCFRELLYNGEEDDLNPSHQVYFAGCNLRCEFCTVAEWNENPGATEETNIDDLQKRIAERKRQGAGTLNLLGGEPAVSIYGILVLLSRLDCETTVVWNSNMYYNDIIDELTAGLVDIYLSDLKVGNNQCAEAMLGAADYLEVTKQGDGWVFLDWKQPAEGGRVSAYKIQRRQRPEGAWQDVATAIETESTLVDQPLKTQLEYRVIAINKSGEGSPSNTVMAVL